MIFLKCRSHQVIPLLRISQWFPYFLTVKGEVNKMAFKTLHVPLWHFSDISPNILPPCLFYSGQGGPLSVSITYLLSTHLSIWYFAWDVPPMILAWLTPSPPSGFYPNNTFMTSYLKSRPHIHNPLSPSPCHLCPEPLSLPHVWYIVLMHLVNYLHPLART